MHARRGLRRATGLVEVTTALSLGLLLALLSALALNGGFALQQHGAARAPRVALRRPIASACGLLRARRWLVGFTLGLLGWALYVAALAWAPLSLVQAVAASGIGLLVLGVAVGSRRLPARRETVGALVATLGLAALGLSLRGAPAVHHVMPDGVRLGACAVVVVSLAIALARRGSAGSIGASAGLAYGLGDVATKALMDSLHVHAGVSAALASPYLAAALACHGAGFVLLQHAFQQGGVVAAIAPMTASMNLLPMLAGVLVLGDPLPGSPPLLALRVAAFGAAALGAWLLSRTHDADAVAIAVPEGRAAPSRPSPLTVGA